MLKKIMIRAGIGVGILVVAVAFFAGWFFSQIKDLNVAPSEQINERIVMIKGGMTNIFLVKTAEKQYIAFDAGDKPDVIKDEMARFNIDPAWVTAVFLTHSDDDHVAALPLFTNAAVYLSDKEVPLIDGRGKRKFLFMRGNNKLCTKSYTGLPDSDCVCVSSTQIQAVATPGHTPGSMCYMVDSNLFTGDLCILKKGIVHPMVQVFTENMKQDSQSIRDVAKIGGIGAIYTSHTGYTADIEKALGGWRK